MYTRSLKSTANNAKAAKKTTAQHSDADENEAYIEFKLSFYS
jgi:hypothetical protein